MDMTLFSEIRPTWEVLPFGEGKDILPTCISWEKPAICPMMIGNKLVYCIIKIYKVAKQKRTMLHVHFGQSCIIAS